MKRLVALVAAATVAVALAAVATARTSSPPTMHPGTLVVGFGDPAVNFANGKVRGSSYLNPKGYEVDLATAIATGLGLKPSFVYTPWAKLFAPGHKTFDISFQEATITAQRKKTIDFTHSYFDANQGVLLSKKAKVPHSIADLKKHADLRPDRHDRPDVDPAEAASGQGAAHLPDAPPLHSSRCRSAGATRSSSIRRSSRPRRRPARHATARSPGRS